MITEQFNLFGGTDKVVDGADLKSPNPMIVKYGAHSDTAKRCGECDHLIKDGHHTRSYFKCKLRGISRSEATDHRKKWVACRMFEEK